VRTRMALGADDPLPFLLTDPRAVRQTDDRHGMWARVLDVPAALSARRYATEVDAVVEVHDGVWGRGGRFHLVGGPDGADCTASVREPDAHVEIGALGAVYFGGHRLRTLVAAGRASVADPRTLRRLDLALTADADPRYGTSF
jgi:predicted acetyltransferase